MFKKLKNKFVTLNEPETEIFQKKEATFITIDGNVHKNSNYRWCKITGLKSRSMEKYAMIGITSDGYIKDNDGIIYPLHKAWLLT